MTDTTLLEIMEALVDQIDAELSPHIQDLQVSPMLTWNPTPPAIDVYPADTPQQQLGMGAKNRELYLTVRAMVNTPDHEGAQELLLSMMDYQGDTSVVAAIAKDRTLSGKVDSATVSEGPAGFGVYVHPSGQGLLLSAGWTVRVLP